MNKLIFLTGIITSFFMVSCDQKADTAEAEQKQKLPILGRHEYIDEDGVKDTIFHKVGKFSFVNQDSVTIDNSSVKDKIYVTDFFFTSCPTICPKMKQQMLRVYDSISDEPDVIILSHTIDPEYDSVEVLRQFAEQLGVKSDKWHFLTGTKSEIYKLAQASYMVTAMEDSSEPGGFVHNGAFLLVDPQGRIRGYYDGTDPVDVNELIADIDILKREYEN